MEPSPKPSYSYASALHTSERVAFRIDSVLRPDAEFDFSRPFLPESLAATARASVLSPADRLRLNQVRGYSYLCLFGLVEEFILPFVLDHARPDLGSDDVRTRALLNFASEEAKHIQLFKRFRTCFERGFGYPGEVIGPPDAVGRAVLGHGPLSVSLLILHIEWMTQRHYVDGVRDENTLEFGFKSLLTNHWLEEAQHAKLDTLIVEQLAGKLTPREIHAGIEEYLELTNALRDLLEAQVGFDLETFACARGRALTGTELAELRERQRRAVFWTFLGSGMTHPKFLSTIEKIGAGGATRVRALSEPFCETKN
jgi:hypothetical protein